MNKYSNIPACLAFLGQLHWIDWAKRILVSSGRRHTLSLFVFVVSSSWPDLFSFIATKNDGGRKFAREISLSLYFYRWERSIWVGMAATTALIETLRTRSRCSGRSGRSPIGSPHEKAHSNYVLNFYYVRILSPTTDELSSGVQLKNGSLSHSNLSL